MCSTGAFCSKQKPSISVSQSILSTTHVAFTHCWGLTLIFHNLTSRFLHTTHNQPLRTTNIPWFGTDDQKIMFVFPAMKRNHCFFFCRCHASLRALLHINDVSYIAAPSIHNIVFTNIRHLVEKVIRLLDKVVDAITSSFITVIKLH